MGVTHVFIVSFKSRYTSQLACVYVVNMYVSTTTFLSGKNLILRNDLDLECGCDMFYSAAMINNPLLLLAVTSALLCRPNIDTVSAVLSSWQLHAVNADTSANLTHLPKSTWPTRTVLDADYKTIKTYYSLSA